MRPADDQRIAISNHGVAVVLRMKINRLAQTLKLAALRFRLPFLDVARLCIHVQVLAPPLLKLLAGLEIIAARRARGRFVEFRRPFAQ